MTDAPTKKDAWDRTTALAAVLIPAAIALAGHFIGKGIQNAQIASQNATARENLKIAQASLINTLMKSLTSSNPQERKLAVQAILIALPDEGPAFARTLAQTDEDKSVQASAERSIDQRIEELMRDMFGVDPSVRKQAAQQIVSGWRGDRTAVARIVAYATQNIANDNGVYNTLVVLGEFSREALLPNRERITIFADEAKRKGPRTSDIASKLLLLLQQ